MLVLVLLPLGWSLGYRFPDRIDLLVVFLGFLTLGRGKGPNDLRFGLDLLLNLHNFLVVFLFEELSQLLLSYLELFLYLVDMVFQNIDSLVVDGILCGKVGDQILYKCVLLHYDCVHPHADLVEAVIQQKLPLLELLDLGGPVITAGVNCCDILLDFAHEVVHGLLASSQLSQLGTMGSLDLLSALYHLVPQLLGVLLLLWVSDHFSWFWLYFGKILEELA